MIATSSRYAFSGLFNFCLSQRSSQVTSATMYSIERTRPTSDATPPWESMVFTQQVDSDDLHEQLKRLYPQCKTLRERKHMAAIHFLSLELIEMQSKDGPVITEECPFLRPLFDPVASSFSTTETLAEYKQPRDVSETQSSIKSTESHVIMRDQLQHRILPSPLHASKPPSPSAVGSSLQFIFDSENGHYVKPRNKRKMTTDEKMAYKRTRKHGACKNCRRLKGRVCNRLSTSTQNSVLKSLQCTHANDTDGHVGSSEDALPQRSVTSSSVTLCS
jgi:hypothetical protein